MSRAPALTASLRYRVHGRCAPSVRHPALGARAINCPGEGTLSSWIPAPAHPLPPVTPALVLPCLQLLDPPADSAAGAAARPQRSVRTSVAPGREATVCDVLFQRHGLQAERLARTRRRARPTRVARQLFAAFFRSTRGTLTASARRLGAHRRRQRVVKAEDDGWPLRARGRGPLQTWSSYSDACALRSRGRTAAPAPPTSLSTPQVRRRACAQAALVALDARRDGGVAALRRRRDEQRRRGRPLASLLDAICADGAAPPRPTAGTPAGGAEKRDRRRRARRGRPHRPTAD